MSAKWGKSVRDTIDGIYRKAKTRKTILMTLSCFVVFATTYLLILPAITLDQDEAVRQGGIDVPDQSEELQTAENQVQDADTQQAGVLSYEGKGYEVILDCEDTRLPDGTELAAEEISSSDADYKALCEDALAAVRADSRTQIGSLAFAKFYDISLLAGGEQIEPEGTVNVTISYDKALKVSDAEKVRIVHFAVDEKTGEVTPEVLGADDVALGIKKAKMTETSFETGSFSVFGIVYTVDFEYDVDGRKYAYSIEGGGSISLADLLQELQVVKDDPETSFDEAQLFMEEISEVTFSSPELVRVEQQDSDWILTSLQPFESEESLTVTMKNGDQFVIRVTDAQEVENAEASTIDVNKSYLICYEKDGVYYLLKNDGTVDSSYHPDFEGDTDAAHDFEHLNSTYAWSFYHIFKENDVSLHLDKNYYLIRPIDNRSKTLTLNNAGEALIQSNNNNVAVFQNNDGFVLEGYHNVGTEENPRYIHLGFTNGAFAGVDGDGVTIHIYEMDSLPTYDYTVRSADETRGSVNVSDGTLRTVTHEGASDTHYYDATSNSDKKNAGVITATPVEHRDGNGTNKWQFDHWEQDGTPIDRDQYPAAINAETLPIPFNGSDLVAYFRQNSAYVVPNNEKTPSTVEDMTEWLSDLTTRNIPLDDTATTKTAEVYDYENRIYRVDITSKANFETFAGNIDMAFCLDVSNSMKFPSKLEAAASDFSIYTINDHEWWYDNRNLLDQSKAYYLIADPNKTATVFRLFYYGDYWYAMDESKYIDQTKNVDASQKNQTAAASGDSFRIGVDSKKMTWLSSASQYPFSSGDGAGSAYAIYTAGDGGLDRFYFLNQTLLQATTDLRDIKDLLAVAGDASPGVKVAYNTFNKNLGSARSDFSVVTPLTVDFTYSAGGGTRPAIAFQDAGSFSWTAAYDAATGETDRYVVLITDGAPQGLRDGERNVDFVQETKDAAAVLKTNSHVKLITIGLSMENVTEGKELLYDIADNDTSGNKMFYLAESASELPNIMRQVIKTIMDEAMVIANVTDTVNDAFYLVDKATGMALNAGDEIDIEGRKVTDSSTQTVAGVVLSDGKTVKWSDQAIDQANGWHGTLYVKAKEDLIGGNAVKTNGSANVTATGYTMSEEGVSSEEVIPFDNSLVSDKLKSLSIDLSSPRVNVNELSFPPANTEWTVYLGTEVDPKEQLQKLYEAILVKEVINTEEGLFYELTPNSFSDDREEDDAGNSLTIGTAKTFELAPVILEIIKADDTLRAKYVKDNALNWDAFLTDILDGGVTLPYHPYGIEGEDSNLVITLTKAVAVGEQADLVSQSPHATTVAGNEVEKYVLTVKYNPDYTHVLPIGQGGGGTLEYHTGTYGSMYQGHAAGRETSTNTHVINVFAKKLQIQKVDQEGNLITGGNGATFGLYRKATSDELSDDTVTKTTLTGLTGSYVLVQTLSTADGVVTTEALSLLTDGEPYYLVETKAPDGYNILTEPLQVTIDMDGHNTWTKLADGSESQTKPAPYELSNWLQEATIKVTDKSGDPSGAAIRVLPSGASGITYDHTNDTTDASATYKIVNSAGVELPSAGGPGTTWIYLLGSLLLLGCGVVLVARRRMA